MSTPEPAQAISAMIDRLAAIRASKAINELELMRLQQEARRLLPKAPGDAHMILGIIADTRNDEAGADQEFKAALACGRTEARLLNRAVMLVNFFRPREALEELLPAVREQPGEHCLSIIREAFKSAWLSGQLHVAADLLRRYRQMDSGSLGVSSAVEAQLPAFVEAADALGLTDGAMAAIQDPAMEALRTLGRRVDFRVNDTIRAHPELSLQRTYWVSVSVEEGYALNEKMAEIWAESDDVAPIEAFCPIIRGGFAH